MYRPRGEVHGAGWENFRIGTAECAAKIDSCQSRASQSFSLPHRPQGLSSPIKPLKLHLVIPLAFVFLFFFGLKLYRIYFQSPRVRWYKLQRWLARLCEPTTLPVSQALIRIKLYM